MKEKVKRELGFIGKGAKLLPKVAGQKVKGYIKAQAQMARERSAAEAEARLLGKVAETEAYKEESRKQAVLKGRARGIARAKGQGSGLLAQLGEVGTRLQDPLGYYQPRTRMGKVKSGFEDPLGMGGLTGKPMPSTGAYLLSGLSQPRSQQRSRRHTKTTKRKHGR